MLPSNRLALAIEIQSQSYQLLQWVAQAVRRGFIPATRAHQYANAGDTAHAWMREHFENLPPALRPDRRHLREFASFFGTYLTTSFDILEAPGLRLESRCGCYCPLCSRLVSAPHLRAKRPTKRDKERAMCLMVNRVLALAGEEGIAVAEPTTVEIACGDETRRSAGYSAYGHWLIRRLEGDTDGTAVLALWREIAWTRTGSPIRNFRLRFEDFVDAEVLLVETLRSRSGD